MFPYYVLVLAPLLVCMLEYGGFFAKSGAPSLPGAGGEAEKVKKRGITLFFFIFLTMLALRSVQCGVDMKTYSHDFARYSGYGWKKILLAPAPMKRKSATGCSTRSFRCSPTTSRCSRRSSRCCR